MNDGFHCPCGEWAVPHDGGAVSNVRRGYELWGEHVRAVLAAAPCGIVVPAATPSGQAPCGITGPHEHAMGDGKVTA